MINNCTSVERPQNNVEPNLKSSRDTLWVSEGGGRDRWKYRTLYAEKTVCQEVQMLKTDGRFWNVRMV